MKLFEFRHPPKLWPWMRITAPCHDFGLHCVAFIVFQVENFPQPATPLPWPPHTWPWQIRAGRDWGGSEKLMMSLLQCCCQEKLHNICQWTVPKETVKDPKSFFSAMVYLLSKSLFSMQSHLFWNVKYYIKNKVLLSGGIEKTSEIKNVFVSIILSC